MQLTCAKCNKTLPVDCFKSQQVAGSTRNPKSPNRQCKDCERAWHKEWARKQRLKKGMVPNDSPEVIARVAATKQRKREQNLVRLQEWAKTIPNETQKEMRKKCWERYTERNPMAPRMACAKRRAAKRNAVTKWGSDGIEDVYLEAKYFQMEVDHIIPLVSKIVCGLHNVFNLQLLKKSENSIKRNKFNPDTYVHDVPVSM
jgi:hypothetical protein